MRLSTSTNILFERIDGSHVDQETTICLCAKAGYQVLDFCFHDLITFESKFQTEAWKDYLLEMKDLAKARSLTFALGHAIVYDFCDTKVDQARYNMLMERCILGAELLEISWLVVHPSTVLTERFEREKPLSKAANVAFFQKWGRFAEQHHVGLAIENMWDASLDTRAKYAGREEELIDLVDCVGLANVGICWDFEHGSIMKQNQTTAVRTMGSRLKAIHVSDQTGVDNIHILPYQGVTDWDEVMKALADSGYQGEFNYEIQWYLRCVPEKLFLSSLKYSVDIGTYMVERINQYRNQ